MCICGCTCICDTIFHIFYKLSILVVLFNLHTVRLLSLTVYNYIHVADVSECHSLVSLVDFEDNFGNFFSLNHCPFQENNLPKNTIRTR